MTTPSLALSPNPVAPGANFDIAGSGFDPKKKVQLAYNGTGYTTNLFRPKRDGSFIVGMKADSSEGADSVTARLQGSTTVVATASVTVKKPVVTPPPVDPAPVITAGPTVTEVTETGARIGWQLSEPGTGQVEYGKTTTYGQWSTLEPGLLPSHSQVLAGVTADTTYHFRIHSKDAAGQEVVSPDVTFRTLAVLPGPEPPPTTGKVVNVTSVQSFMSAMADGANGEVVLRDAAYGIAGANRQLSSSLYFGDRYRRTTRVLGRPETVGGVTLDAGVDRGHIAFKSGACLVDLVGFRLAGGVTVDTGVITVGGSDNVTDPGAHDINLRKFWILPSVRGSGSTAQGFARDHGVYAGEASDGPHDVLFEDFDIDCAGGLASGFQFEDHDHNCSHHFTFRRFAIRNAQQAIMCWRAEHDVLFDTGTIANSSMSAITFRSPGSATFRNVRSTGSGQIPVDTDGGSGLVIEPSCVLA